MSLNKPIENDATDQPGRFALSPIQLGGLALVAIGADLFLASYLRKGWLALLIVPIGGLLFLFTGARLKQLGLIIAGGLIFGLGAGSFLAFGNLIDAPLERRVGLLLLSFAIGWALIALFTRLFSVRFAWWALIPAGIIAAAGACFFFSELRFVDFVLYIVTGIGIVLLAWGVLSRLFGLIIPGSLLIGIGPGIYIAWGQNAQQNSLAQTGIMLVWFALGWGLIILFSRVITDQFVWWPLIPGGVLAMVGWGLYIGGNPGNAVSFIGNTGSVVIIILGLYLLLLRNGIRK